MQVEHHTLERDGLHWHVVTSGPADAPPLLLLHCWTGNWTQWEKTMVALDGQYRFIVPDHLGFGQSDKPVGNHYGIQTQAERTHFILNYFGHERARVMGHSMGGQMALTFAGMYPDAVERLIVVDPVVTGKLHPLTMPMLLWMRLTRWGMAPLIEAIIRLGLRVPALSLQLTRSYWPHPFQQREAAIYWVRQVIADNQIRSAAWAEYSAVTWDTTPLLDKISAPALAIWGIKDYCVPLSECTILEKNIMNFQAFKLPEIGHFPMIEAWPAFIQKVETFLKAS